jgi:hypothetical protein
MPRILPGGAERRRVHLCANAAAISACFAAGLWAGCCCLGCGGDARNRQSVCGGPWRRTEAEFGGEQPETLACKLKEGVQNSKQVNLVMCGTSDLALARRFALRLFREGYAGTVYAYRSWLTINEEGKMFGRKIYNDLEGVSPEVAKSLDKGKRVPANEVIATFDKESFAEEFAADKEGDQSLLSFLHGGESDHKVAASDDDRKTDHGSLLEQ